MTGGADPAGQRVYLLEAIGTFDGRAEKLPAGAHPSPGTTLSVIVDAVTLRVLDLGLTNAPHNLPSLGHVVSL